MIRKKLYPGLYEDLAPYRITKDEDMPAAYRQGTGRELHGDWAFLKKTPRIETAYNVPLPFIKIAGNADPIWTPIRRKYPIVPGTEVKILPWWDGDNQQVLELPHVLTMHPIHAAGKWSRQAAFINGKWRECYYSRSVWTPLGKAPTYWGLKLDPHYDDICTHFPELSVSLKWLSWA